MRALIVEDGRQRSALAAARALAGAGWEVGIGAPEKGFACWSRCTARWHRVPRPSEDLEGFARAVSVAVAGHGYDVVFGAGDAETVALSLLRDRFAAPVPHAPHDAVMSALDKLVLAENAEEAGLASPATQAATEETLEKIEGPTIVKARLHWDPRSDRAPGHVTVARVNDRAEARARAAEIRAEGGDPLLQESIEGRLLAYIALVDVDGRIVADLQQVAERTFPPGAGVSARATTVPIERDLAEGAARLLKKLGWSGLAELQFIAPSSGPPRLIDLNGRFYGSLELAVAAGVNLPALWGELALGRTVGVQPPAEVGVRYQWLEGDIRHALASGEGKIGAMTRCLAFGLRANHSILDAADPMPALRHVGRLGRRALRKARS